MSNSKNRKLELLLMLLASRTELQELRSLPRRRLQPNLQLHLSSRKMLLQSFHTIMCHRWRTVLNRLKQSATPRAVKVERKPTRRFQPKSNMEQFAKVADFPG